MNNNPFTGFGNVVEDDSRLIGREFQIEQLYSDIMSGANCSITGLRRIGKTSVAMALIRKLEKYHPEITCEFIDFSTLDNETSVYSEMMEVLGGESESCTSPEIAFKLLKRFLIERKRQYGRSVIVVDEFDAVTKSVFKAPDMVLNRFRSLLQQSKYGINMVIISRRNLLRIEKELARREDTDNISNLAQTFQRHIICPLGEPDSRKMIERSNKSWGDDAIREVYSLCGGHPYLTEELLYYVERNDCANEISQKDVLDALADCKVDFLSYFSTIRDFSKSSGCWDLFCERLVGLGSSNYDLLSENTLREYGVFKKTEQGWQAMSELLEDLQ